MHQTRRTTSDLSDEGMGRYLRISSPGKVPVARFTAALRTEWATQYQGLIDDRAWSEHSAT